MTQSSTTLDARKPTQSRTRTAASTLEEPGPALGDVKKRTFRFDSESVRANHKQVVIRAAENDGHSAYFVITIDEGSEETEHAGPGDDAIVFRAHGAGQATQLIVGMLPAEPMRSLVRWVLQPEPKDITLNVATYP